MLVNKAMSAFNTLRIRRSPGLNRTIMPRTILLVEDDPHLTLACESALEKHGFVVVSTNTIAEARRHIHGRNFDAIVLDRLLPDGDGIELLDKNMPPKIIVSGLGECSDVVAGLSAGASAYIRKPFETAELLAWLDAVLRHNSAPRTVAGFLDCYSRTLRVGQNVETLDPTEFALLLDLVNARGNPRSIPELAGAVFAGPSSRKLSPGTIRMYISRVRAAFDGSTWLRILYPCVLGATNGPAT